MKSVVAAACLATLAPLAQAQGAPDIQALREEIRQLREQYEARIKALEAKLDAAQAQPAAAAPVPAPAPVAAAPGKGFNPQLSLNLSGLYSRSRNPSLDRGFSLGESELGLSANIDPWFSGFAAISFSPDNTASVEEAYVQTTSLGKGFTVKAGRFFSSIGYLNSQHAHVWDFVDQPLAYQALLGEQYADDGVQVAWLAPTDTFLELRGEVGRGRSFPGTNTSRNGAGATALSLHSGGDIGESSSWRAGVSVLNARGDDTTSSTRVWVADGVWKWAPNGNATRTNFKVQGEYLRSVSDDRPTQSGWYTQAIYQFMRGWRVGLRTERLEDDRKNSVMLDWSPSEFSRVRLQYARDRSSPFGKDNQWFLQYMMSLGAHGAHGF
ncbi:hypothetical protein [Ramlibacter sp. PS4R-6]|uniref:hypothetical protein n=1 Tax=Ramlibacter sp. PS4R-6 TaxID=3133438 RepID=UPI00309C120B